MNEKNRLHKPARVYQMHFAADFFTKDYKIKTLWLLPKSFLYYHQHKSRNKYAPERDDYKPFFPKRQGDGDDSARRRGDYAGRREKYRGENHRAKHGIWYIIQK